MFYYDLTSNGIFDTDEKLAMIKEGSMRISVKFTNQHKKTIVCIIYGICDATLEITKE